MEFIREFFLWVFIVLILCITIPIFLAIGLFSTLLWPICAICKGIESLLGLNKKEKQTHSDNLQEFIFLCYGIAVACLIFPFTIGDDWYE